jgi:hypothetical protein
MIYLARCTEYFYLDLFQRYKSYYIRLRPAGTHSFHSSLLLSLVQQPRASDACIVSQPKQYVVHNRDRQRYEYPKNYPARDRRNRVRSVTITKLSSELFRTVC